MNGAMVIRPLSQTLRAIASELAELTSIASHAQPTSAGQMALVDAHFADRQQLTDLLTQRLAGLTAFVDALAIAAPQGVALDVGGATDGLPLGAQARRLCGLGPSDLAPNDGAAGGQAADLAPAHESGVVVALAGRRRGARRAQR